MTASSDAYLTAAARIDALMQIHPKGYDLSLDRIRGLLAKLGNPQDKLPPVMHFAGTNGKGSTIAFCRSLLEAAGLAVHVHTSPHLVSWSERYRLGQKGGPGVLVDDAVLSDAIRRVAEANDGQPITVFEVLTAVSFVLFSEHPADICLIEVGLGGRLDCTNVMKETAVAVISSISIDHEAWLGDTLARIAFEKAGIIKSRTPVAVGRQEDEALDTIRQQAERLRAPMTAFGEDFQASVQDGQFVYQDDNAHYFAPLPVLTGDHQIENAALAIAACRALPKQVLPELTAQMVETGLATANWPARMQRLPQGVLTAMLGDNRDIWLDGGHNPGAAERISAHLTTLNARASAPLVMICGMLDTKDAAGYFHPFASLDPMVITVPITSSDAGVPPEKLAQVAQSAGLRATASTSLTTALESINIATPRILLCGSLYLAGDVLDQNGTPPV